MQITNNDNSNSPLPEHNTVETDEDIDTEAYINVSDISKFEKIYVNGASYFKDPTNNKLYNVSNEYVGQHVVEEVSPLVTNNYVVFNNGSYGEVDSSDSEVDSNTPNERPLTYFQWFKGNRATIVKAFPGISGKDVAKKARELWSSLSPTM